MKAIKVFFVSYCLFATFSILPMNGNKATTPKIKNSISSSNSFRTAIGSAARTTRYAGILFGVYVYADQIIKGPKDFTKFPEFSSQDIKNRCTDIIITINNTRRSLGFQAITKEETAHISTIESDVTTTHISTPDISDLQGGDDNNHKD